MSIIIIYKMISILSPPFNYNNIEYQKMQTKLYKMQFKDLEKHCII